MKRLAIYASVFIVVVFLGMAAALPLLISSERVRQRIVDQTRETTGQELSFSGNPTVSFNPFLEIELRDVNLVAPNTDIEETPLAKIEILRGKISWLPALFGRIRLRELSFIRPHFNLVKKTDGTANWVFKKGKIAQLATKAENETSDPISLGGFQLTDAIVHYDDAIAGVERTLTNLQATGYWDNTDSVLEFSGTAIWKGIPVTLDGQTENALQLAFGGKSNTSFVLASEALELNFDGMVDTVSEVQFSGTGKIGIPSLSRLGQLSEVNLKGPIFPTTVSASGDVSGSFTSLNFANAAISLDDNPAQGSLQIRIDELSRLNISTTLAFDDLDLQRTSDRFAAQDFSPMPDDVVIDARISASHTMFGKLVLENLATALVLKDGKLEIDIGDSSFAEGRLFGKITTKNTDGGYDLSTNLTLSSTNIEQLFGNFLDQGIAIQGIGNLNVKFDSKLVKGMPAFSKPKGKVELKMGEGSLIGIDLPAITASFLKTSEVENKPNLLMEANGKTEFQNMTAELELTGGVALFNKFALSANEQLLELQGIAKLKGGGAALRATLTGLPGNNDSKVKNHFFIGGTLANPMITRHRDNGKQSMPKQN